MEECSLCGSKCELQKSHIVPKFVGSYLKKTSATGYLRATTEINKRIQDLVKFKLLCKSCENKLSVFEGYFAKNLFYPHVEEGKTEFNYNELLQKFIISISWRVLKTNLKNYKKENGHSFKVFSETLDHLKRCLIENRCDDIYEHHLLFLDYIENAEGVNLPDKFQCYIMRSVDATIVSNKDRAFVFTKLPGVIIVSSIKPTKLENWIGTKVNNQGTIKIPQKVKDGEFGEFLLSRAKQAFSQPISERQSKIISESIGKDLRKTLGSKSFRTVLEDYYLKNK